MRRNLLWQSALFLALSLSLSGCGGRESQQSGASPVAEKPLTIKGSDTMVILGQRLAEEFMKKNSGLTVQVNGGGSGTGIAALINGTVDLAQSSRTMKDDERAKAEKNRGARLVETAVAIDALAVFVNESNSVKELTLDQVAGIYMGKTKNWEEVGGKRAPIVLYGRENSSGTYDYFREHVLSKADFAPAVQTLQGTAAIINAVGKDPNGIGYGGIAYARDVRALAIRKDGSTSGVEPKEETVADGTYPLSRKLFFYYLDNAHARVTRFVNWTLTPEAQELVEKVGYFPLSDAAAPASEPVPTSSVQ